MMKKMRLRLLPAFLLLPLLLFGAFWLCGGGERPGAPADSGAMAAAPPLQIVEQARRDAQAAAMAAGQSEAQAAGQASRSGGAKSGFPAGCCWGKP